MRDALRSNFPITVANEVLFPIAQPPQLELAVLDIAPPVQDLAVQAGQFLFDSFVLDCFNVGLPSL